VSALRIIIKIVPVAVAVHLRQGRFRLWILWKIRPEFHTRKPLVQNSKQAFSQQSPQALLLKTQICQKYKVGLVHKTKTQTTLKVGHTHHKRTVLGGCVWEGRATGRHAAKWGEVINSPDKDRI
jgi:hypothetical protein